MVAGTAASAVAGGIGSVLGGGKFENGAVTGAFSYAMGRAMRPRETNKSNATSNEVAGPGARSQKWRTGDFVKHYFKGGGARVHLSHVGLADDFENSKSVIEKTTEFVKDTLQQAAPGYSRSDKVGTDVTWEANLFSVGRSAFFRSAACGATHCVFQFKIRDWFRDPIDIGIEIYRGTPYRIDHSWIEFRSYGQAP